MVDIGTIAIAIVAGIASLFMAWTIGAGSSGSTPFAPAVGARAISVMRAAFLVGIFGFLGAVLQGANVAEAMAAGMIKGVTLTPVAVVVGLSVAAGLVAIGIFTGYPIATAFTATGAVVGVGLALGGAPAWGKYVQVGTLWVLTPFVGGGLAYATARLLRGENVSDILAISLLGGIVGLVIANIPFAFLGSTPAGGSIASVGAAVLSVPGLPGEVVVSMAVALVLAAVLAVDVKQDSVAGQRRFLLGLGALVAFSAGGSQVGLAVGPLVPVVRPLAIPVVAILIGGGIGLLAGSWMGSSRMIKAIAQDYSSLGPRRAIAALIPSFIIAQVAVLFGIPISFNEIVVSAVVGSGFAAGGAGVSRAKIGYTVLAWAGSLVLSIVVAYGALSAVQLLI